MKSKLTKSITVLLLFFNISFFSKGADTLDYTVILNYYKDLSDTYGVRGSLFSGEFTLSRSWYGLCLSFGNFQSQSTYKFKFLIEEINETFEIPVEEMAIMQTSSISGFIRPIQQNWIDLDILIGTVYGYAKNSRFKSFDYVYNLEESKITSFSRDYELIKKNHFGYQVGFTISLYPTKKIGFQISSRLQDLSNGGTFFFVGGGLCFRL
jgi:hypothetical protein